MPFDKKHELPALPIAAIVLSLSLLLGGIAVHLFRGEREAPLFEELLENEAVVAFLMLEDGE